MTEFQTEAGRVAFAEACSKSSDFWARKILELHMMERDPEDEFGTSQLGFQAGLAMALGCCVRASADMQDKPDLAGEALLNAMVEVVAAAYTDNPLEVKFEVAQ